MQRQHLKEHSSAILGWLSKHYSVHKFCFGSFCTACTGHFKWEEGNPQSSLLSCSLVLHSSQHTVGICKCTGILYIPT